MRERPRIAVTVGDPAGIGPEIALSAASDERVREACEPIVYAPPDLERYPAGVLSAEAGRAAYDVIVRAVKDAMEGRVAAVATGPVNKKAFALAGLPWRGHTDLLAHLTGASRVAMLFYSPSLVVSLATSHIRLSEVPAALTRERLDSVVRLTAAAMPRFGVPNPRLLVLGLNPHAGEEGLMGDEDERVIRPVVAACRAEGMSIEGPAPADTAFVKASRGEFDAVVACYHDQGLIPVKLLAFGRAVNVTLGLPIVRTSVDHGTAFDIAGRGVADPGSLVEAILLAARLASH